MALSSSLKRRRQCDNVNDRHIGNGASVAYQIVVARERDIGIVDVTSDQAASAISDIGEVAQRNSKIIGDVNVMA